MGGAQVCGKCLQGGGRGRKSELGMWGCGMAGNQVRVGGRLFPKGLMGRMC